MLTLRGKGETHPLTAALFGGGGSEDDQWLEASRTQIKDVIAISDLLLETPQGQNEFDLAKWGMFYPHRGGV